MIASVKNVISNVRATVLVSTPIMLFGAPQNIIGYCVRRWIDYDCNKIFNDAA
jgi:hypothetical protein